MQYSSWLQHHSCWSGVTCRPPTRGGNVNDGFKMYCRSCAQDNDIRKYKVENLLVSEYFLTDMRSGTVAVSKYLNASYWDWCDGSSLLFWRWPFEFRTKARDGFKPCFVHKPPGNHLRQTKFPPQDVPKIWEKMKKFLLREYISIIKPSDVKNLTHYFTVPKGDGDVRMVFNGTKSGLTDALWAPSFRLPNAASMLRILSFGHRSVDIDLGEHF